MKSNKHTEPINGVLTERMNISSDEFKQFQIFLLGKSQAQTKLQKIKVELAALKFQLEDYLHSSQKNELVLVGEFLQLYLQTLKIRQVTFANYIELKPSNFNKLLKGERSINSETAIKLGKIFEIDPMIWLEIQSKNELMKLSDENNNQFKKYSLRNLIKQI